MNYQLHHGDCLEVMATMADNSVDAIVTDPPYGLSFMGKNWDHGVPGEAFWREALRVAKPGAHLLAFGGTRTFHRLAVAIEDAGFEIRDMIAWVYGSGFNKVGYIKDSNGETVRDGWGGSLKPALEPITMARKPLAGTVAANVLEHGTGALNVDGCRVDTQDRLGRTRKGVNNLFSGLGPQDGGSPPQKRWPANLIHDGSEEVVGLFPETTTGGGDRRGERSIFGGDGDSEQMRSFEANSGSAARFFYCAKASKADRGEGNTHPTVKPTDLMRYLCRLVTPPGGIVLDPFMGSGSTGKAAILEGFQFIGIERDAEYLAIAEARISHASGLSQLPQRPTRQPPPASPGQLALFYWAP